MSKGGLQGRLEEKIKAERRGWREERREGGGDGGRRGWREERWKGT